MLLWHFIEITNTLISNNSAQLFKMLTEQNKSRIFAYLSAAGPPKPADPRIGIQTEIF